MLNLLYGPVLTSIPDYWANHNFGYLMRRTDSFEKTLMLGKIKAGGEGDNRG